MKQKKAILFCALLALLAAVAGAGVQEDFAAANRLYEEGKFAAALPLYLGVSRQVTNWKVLFNIGNCHYKLEKPLKGFLREDKEAGIYEIWDNAEPYIVKWFGEAALSIGKSVDWIENGADGIINVLPFTCIPGNIVNAVSKRIREKYKIPWLNLAFDGLEQETTETRLEAFMYQAKQYMKNKK